MNKIDNNQQVSIVNDKNIISDFYREIIDIIWSHNFFLYRFLFFRNRYSTMIDMDYRFID